MRAILALLTATLLATLVSGCGSSSPAQRSQPIVPSSARSPTEAAPERVVYGAAPQAFGDLYLPVGADRAAPVVVLIHGGFWRNRYGLDLMAPLAGDLARRGDAVWNIEYRRLGDNGGGWPGTFDDVAAAIDGLESVSRKHPGRLDLANVAVVGHSAGGHLALWAAGRDSLADGDPGAHPLVHVRVAVGQGPVVDLRAASDAGLGGGAALELLGGTPAEVPRRYEAATPHASTMVRLVVVRGSADDIVPARFTVPDPPGATTVIDVPGADHFDLIDPASPAWSTVVSELNRSLS